ncbi:unnamed protein product [Citrullus colocynthis]|uniref:Uncharacterized protein n=1 Tax=Citrullus colocynthis TaxID=252529 RepID=A0ABP0XX28_9ROSI
MESIDWSEKEFTTSLHALWVVRRFPAFRSLQLRWKSCNIVGLRSRVSPKLNIVELLLCCRTSCREREERSRRRRSASLESALSTATMVATESSSFFSISHFSNEA